MASAAEILAQNDPKAAKKAVAAKVGEAIVDLGAEIDPAASTEPVLPGSAEALDILRHSTAHIMAEAVKELFPGVKVAIGPAIENGFYYDFDYERAFTPEDLPAIEEKMAQIIKNNLPFACRREPTASAREYFGKQGEVYKVELRDEL